MVRQVVMVSVLLLSVVVVAMISSCYATDCRDQEDCKSHECCVSTLERNGYPECRNLSLEGERCRDIYQGSYPTPYTQHCPCDVSQGLTCSQVTCVKSTEVTTPTEITSPVTTGLCRTQSDCKENECCVGDMGRYNSPGCRRISLEGEHCREYDANLSASYTLFCPCDKGLTCFRATCVKPNEEATTTATTTTTEITPTPRSRQCKTQSDCEENECCVVGMERYSVPSCRPISLEGEYCREYNANLSASYTLFCPCDKDLTCSQAICVKPNEETTTTATTTTTELTTTASPSTASLGFTRCTKQSDCKETECCAMGMHRFSAPRCRPKRLEGQHCRNQEPKRNKTYRYPDGRTLFVEESHTMFCPCDVNQSLTCHQGTCQKSTGGSLGSKRINDQS